MMRQLVSCILACLGLLATVGNGYAQTPVPSPTPATTKLCWDHDGINVDRFEVVIDAQAPTDVGKPVPAGVQYCTPFPALTPGAHTLVVRACNIAGCASAPPFPVQMVVVPSSPTAVRIVTGG